MLDHVLPPDIEDERDLRLKRRDVGEVLLGTNSKVDAAWLSVIGEIRQHILNSHLVRNEIIGNERAAGFGEFGDEFPERLIAELAWNLFGRPAAREEQAKRKNENEADAVFCCSQSILRARYLTRSRIPRSLHLQEPPEILQGTGGSECFGRRVNLRPNPIQQ